MIHTIHIDDSTLKGKQLITKLQKATTVVIFDNPVTTGITPEGYMTVEEFRTETKASLKKLFKENGKIDLCK